MKLRGAILIWLSSIALLQSAPAGITTSQGWEATYAARLKWWSLQPISDPPLPVVTNRIWSRNFIDSFILARLESRGLSPAPEANPETLIRRLSFALTGLPPSPALCNRQRDPALAVPFEQVVQELLSSPHFGEHWARHWMDIVHYSDTHGYEWDAPAKHAWRYRDYLTRAFNSDLPLDRLILEHLAGDLVQPRLDSTRTFNESLIGPMGLRLGERRHGDNAAAEGVTQEAMANVIDTVSKGLLATTVACAQCHDHKLDAVGQTDFFSLAGIFMSTRWNVRCLDVKDPNLPVLEELRQTKHQVRRETARLWLASRAHLLEQIRSTRTTNAPPSGIPDNLLSFWYRCSTNPIPAEEFRRESERRAQINRTNLLLVADFSRPDLTNQWRWDGAGLRHGLVRDGELVVALDGTQAVRHLLPAGRWSHVWSPRLAGALRSPLFPTGAVTTFSVGLAAGNHAAQAMIVDHAFHSERMQFLQQPVPAWKTFTAGRFDTLEGGIDALPRRSYLELVTKSLNNYFPPRTAYGGLSEADLSDERSWFGVTQVFRHAAGQGPLDELQRFAPLFTATGNWEERFADLILSAVERWTRDAATAQDVQLLNEALQLKWLPNRTESSWQLARWVDKYRTLEKGIIPDRTIGSVEEWGEAQDERLGIRGSYTDFGPPVPRGNIRFLHTLGTPPAPELLAARHPTAPTSPARGSSGRFELAQGIIDPRNPLTARVWVNRVWLHLFGEGLVRTPDDFGHLGEKPSHPELLDALAARFMADGWSVQRLITWIVSSASWRQSSSEDERARTLDPENRLLHHYPVRRLEAEAIRDALLAVSGRLDPRLYGPPIDPYRTAEDSAKRLFSGPLDGEGRRSLYLKMTLMEPPRFLALFNQPIPKLTTGRRDVTQVPDQALALLNDPFVIAMAKRWGEQVVRDSSPRPVDRAERMCSQALGRAPRPAELERLLRLVERSTALRQGTSSSIMTDASVWQDVAHALFNLNEFIHVH